ncbi:hypothetical protein ABFS83_06G027200 [Erythranthe nasuta]
MHRTNPRIPTNRRKCIAIIVAGIILQTLIIVVFGLIFLRVTTPKIRFSSITVEKLTVNSTTPSFSIKLNGEVTVKNSNFGHFKFSDSEISVLYRGSAVGNAAVPAGRAGARSTKKMNLTVAVESKSGSTANLGGDLNSGKIALTSQATLSGKIHLFKVIKKRKTATMDCRMDVNTKTRAVENLECN